MYCKNCGEPMNEGQGFCVKCGTASGSGSTRCQKCGSVAAPGASFCATCGAPLNSANQQQGYQFFDQNTFVGKNPAAALIKKREIVTAIILTIVTCGIYGIIWFISLTDDMNRLTGRINESSGATAFLLSLVTCGIYSYYWAYKMGEKRDTLSGSSESSAVLYLILAIFLPIAVYCLAQDAINKEIERN